MQVVRVPFCLDENNLVQIWKDRLPGSLAVKVKNETIVMYGIDKVL